MHCLASSATAILTPASAYFIGRCRCQYRRRRGSQAVILTPASAYFIGSVTRLPCSVIREKRRDTSRARAVRQNCAQSYVERPGGAVAGGGDCLQNLMNRQSLKSAENPPPAHFAGMQDGIGVGEEALAKLPRFPGFRRNVEGHVNHHGRADDVVARNTPPEPAVVRIGAIITHDKIAVGGNPVRYFQLVRLGEIGRASCRERV